MVQIPKNLKSDRLSSHLSGTGLQRVFQGETRDVWRVDSNSLLVVATDRISFSGFVLSELVPKRGEVLTALAHFWPTKVLYEFNHYLIESETHPGFNDAWDLREDFLHALPLERCLTVEDMTGEIYPFKMIFRHHIGGSVYKDYLKTGLAGGQQLPPNLPEWTKLEWPIFTPSTKEDVGHDVNADADYFYSQMAKKGMGVGGRQAVYMLGQAYATAYAYARTKGILILDTKFKVASGPKIVDEILTPDSSWFVLKEDWEEAMAEGRDPSFMDKQPVIDWGEKTLTPFKDVSGQLITGINKLNPANPEHVAFVHNLKIPKEVITDITIRNLTMFRMLTGQSLEDYQKNDMGV
ncbi:MAG: phosphoribosylaminoimidazolesuccinocarboxamide synthase [bacterium]|nr:phosphoribosylaminoimidazolesuccinocarboxamide synthase [bacterium]